ncbi:MAG: T9SS type A sorting domain-containing protein [Bacteroidales bacterium]|nr:T9SS type A sorting domain-containing protein [Bacteroidales bacterium]
MMKRTPIRHILLAVALATAMGVTAQSSSHWESADPAKARQGATVEKVEADQPEVWVKDGYIYITAPRAVTIRIYSILGQMISQEAVPPGTFRLHVASRGIYILKMGNLTRRVTL